jgi:NADPH-dependent 2,4-dienoyl-CoA reductase/sulfur reductase-like enzyme
MVLTAATRKKQVMIVGGGPAGLTVARVAALRGHNVTLYEKTNTCGGQYRLAAVAPSKTELTKALQYLTWQASKAGVKIQLNTEVTPQLVAQVKPECIVIATGAVSSCPNIKCIDGKNVVSAAKVLSGEVEIEPGKILIVGGGMIGLETAELLASNGDNPMIGLFDVTIMEMLDTVGQSMFSEGRTLLMKRLREQGVNILTKTKVLEFFDNGALILRNGKEEVIHGMDKIILAMGMTPYDPLSSTLTGKVPELYVIGDAKKVQQVMQAIAEGYEIGRKI